MINLGKTYFLRWMPAGTFVAAGSAKSAGGQAAAQQRQPNCGTRTLGWPGSNTLAAAGRQQEPFGNAKVWQSLCAKLGCSEELT